MSRRLMCSMATLSWTEDVSEAVFGSNGTAINASEIARRLRLHSTKLPPYSTPAHLPNKPGNRKLEFS